MDTQDQKTLRPDGSYLEDFIDIAEQAQEGEAMDIIPDKGSIMIADSKLKSLAKFPAYQIAAQVYEQVEPRLEGAIAAHWGQKGINALMYLKEQVGCPEATRYIHMIANKVLKTADEKHLQLGNMRSELVEIVNGTYTGPTKKTTQPQGQAFLYA